MLTKLNHFGLIVISFLFLQTCRPLDKKDKHLFTKLSSAETGIKFVNLNTENDQENILTYEYFYNGGGVALGDINNDGLVDIYLSL